MKFCIKDFFSKCDQICSLLRIWSHLLKKSLMENFIFCAVNVNINEDKNKDKGNHHSYDDINNDDHDTNTDNSDK